MALSALIASLLPLFATCPINVSGPMLFLIHRGDFERAFQSYLDFAQENKVHDFSLLQQAAKALIEQGIESKDPDIRKLSLFGAGVASSSDLLPIFAKGIKNADMQTQLIALSYLAKQQDDEADLYLLEALSSPFLIVRLESLLHLAQKNHPGVLEHLYSLIVKVPDPIRSLFSQIAIHLEGYEATRFLKNLLFDPSLNVRIDTLMAIAKGERDDFLPYIRNLSHAASYAQLESCAFAFGALKDTLSLARLKEFTLHQEEPVRLAAALSLFSLGERGFKAIIDESAERGSLFAIMALGQIQESSDLLSKLACHEQRDIRLNATIALLKMRDRRGIDTLREFLFDDGKDLGFWPITSPGGSLTAWRTIPSKTHQDKHYPDLSKQTATLRDALLVQCVEFEESDFLKIAAEVFEKKEYERIPLLMELLLNRKSEAIIALIKEGYQKAGAPLIRHYSTLALFRLNQDGPYEEQLIQWIKEKGHIDMIQFKEEKSPLPLTHSSELTPEESSQFFIEACEALTATQSEAGIEALIHAIAYGNPKNRYALAGLLMKTAE